MRKAALILATTATLAVTAVTPTAPAEAHDGFGPGLAGGLIAGALIGRLASNAYGYGPGYGYYGYAPGYYDDYAPLTMADTPLVRAMPTTVAPATMAAGIAIGGITTGEVQREGNHPLLKLSIIANRPLDSCVEPTSWPVT